MVARLGWNQDLQFPILTQIAKIRASAAEANRKNRKNLSSWAAAGAYSVLAQPPMIPP